MKALKYLRVLTLISFALAINLSKAQDSSFFKTYSGPLHTVFFSTTQTLDGNFMHAGFTIPSVTNSNENSLITKTDTNGNLIWAKQYTLGGNDHLRFTKIHQTANGNYIISGTINNFSSNFHTAILTKIDSTGNVIWNKVFPDTSGSFYLDYSYLLQIPNNNYLIGGSWYNGYVAKIDSSGTVIWSKNLMSIGQNVGCILAIGTDGDYFYSSNLYNADLEIAKLDTNGNLLWNRIFDNVVSKALVSTPDSGIIVVGEHTPTTMVWMKFDKNGNLSWVKGYEFSPSSICYVLSIIRAKSGGYFLGGSINNSLARVLLMKIDSTGNLEWSKVTSNNVGSHFANALQLFESGNFIYLAGTTQPLGYNMGMIFKCPINGISTCVSDIQLTPVTIPTNITSGITVSNSILCNPMQLPSTTMNQISTTICNDVVGINKYDPKKEFIVFPNPFRNHFQIKGIEYNDQVQIFNTLGEDVTNRTKLNANGNIEAKSLLPGIYFISIQTSKGIYSTKIIKE